MHASSGFWQIPLAEASCRLTTFITPFGRYYFNKLPFAISSALELFQRRMSKLLEGIKGVVCLMDNVLVIGAIKDEHDTRLVAVLEHLHGDDRSYAKPAKCEFSRDSMKFLGHMVDKDGIRADLGKMFSDPQNGSTTQCL